MKKMDDRDANIEVKHKIVLSFCSSLLKKLYNIKFDLAACVQCISLKTRSTYCRRHLFVNIY